VSNLAVTIINFNSDCASLNSSTVFSCADLSIKDHTLLQAICRTNRLYPQKSFGRIVDYFGVFDDAAKALEFDEESVKQVITNLSTHSHHWL
jgi:hypothetical protein